MNKKGQALIEFVIVIPIIIMILFAIIDFGLIFYNKNKLENKLNDTARMVINNESEDDINKFLNKEEKNKIEYKIINSYDYRTVEVYTSLNLVTPGLNKILDNPYKITVKRVIYE